MTLKDLIFLAAGFAGFSAADPADDVFIFEESAVAGAGTPEFTAFDKHQTQAEQEKRSEHEEYRYQENSQHNCVF